MMERFELLDELGRGGMGVVWKARDRQAGQFVALKLLHELYRDDAGYIARFEREVDIARLVVSSHVVSVRGYGLHAGVPFVAMEYVEGQTLSQRLRERGPMPWERAKPVLLDVAKGLAAAHRAGVIHRDIKPSNILLDTRGKAKLADFGIARAMEFTRLTGSATMMGTPAYMSPDGEASEQSDLYAVGCVLFEMLTGTPPFKGESQQEIILKHIRDKPDLDRLPRGEARRIGAWLLEKEPANRCASADSLVLQLERSGRQRRARGAVNTEYDQQPSNLLGALTARSERGKADLAPQAELAEGVQTLEADVQPFEQRDRRVLAGIRTAGQALAMMAASVGVIVLLARSGWGDGVATSTPTVAPTLPFSEGVSSTAPPAAPEISAFSWSPADGALGGVVTISMQYGDVNGDATTVDIAVTGGNATWFGTGRTEVSLPGSAIQQMRRTATWEQQLRCGNVPFDTELAYTIVDSTGARSNTAVASFKCL